MKGKWKIESNRINEKTMYRVYRLKDTAAVDHSGNREYEGGYVNNRGGAEELIKLLEQAEKEGE